MPDLDQKTLQYICDVLDYMPYDQASPSYNAGLDAAIKTMKNIADKAQEAHRKELENMELDEFKRIPGSGMTEE